MLNVDIGCFVTICVLLEQLPTDEPSGEIIEIKTKSDGAAFFAVRQRCNDRVTVSCTGTVVRIYLKFSVECIA